MAIDLNGTWRVVYSELNGEMTAVAHFSGIEITYKGTNFEISVHGVLEHAGKFSINEGVSPAQITYTYTKSTTYQLDKPRVGIVQRTGFTFKDCLGAIGAASPSTFNTVAGSNTVMSIHQLSGAEAGRGVSAFTVSPTAQISQW